MNTHKIRKLSCFSRLKLVIHSRALGFKRSPICLPFIGAVNLGLVRLLPLFLYAFVDFKVRQEPGENGRTN